MCHLHIWRPFVLCDEPVSRHQNDLLSSIKQKYDIVVEINSGTSQHHSYHLQHYCTTSRTMVFIENDEFVISRLLPDSIITSSRPLWNTVKMTIYKNGRSGTTDSAITAESDNHIVDTLIFLEHVPIWKIKVSGHSLSVNLHVDFSVLC